jgi:hypothetical protein
MFLPAVLSVCFKTRCLDRSPLQFLDNLANQLLIVGEMVAKKANPPSCDGEMHP